ncbi:carbohydrate-binding protein [Streptomyces sp. NRRL F-5123]|uniref:carbohydrate-binding protein n=1 Tax=Streptomyces sp. NRRL F-5123 TaxID=1463856 RepID=UPI000694FA73|nr:CBM35 domain-containing protein [Streptomyces sp. NRRL F-5123]
MPFHTNVPGERPRRRRAALAGSLLAVTALVGTGLTGTQTAAAATPTFVVDLGTTTGAVLNGSGGALYGQSDAGVPSDNLLAPLKLATGSQKPPNGLQHPSGDILKVAPSFFADGGGTMYTNIQDEYATWPYPTPTLGDYLPTVDAAVNPVKSTAYASKVVFVPFNEPDQQWFAGLSGGSAYAGALSEFETWWNTVYRRIHQDYPAAKIAGPNTAGFSPQFLGDFLTYAKAEDVLPDVITWHELSPGSLSAFRGHYGTYRALEKARGISPIPINIDEYANRRDVSVPGQMIQWAAMFEDEKVYADQAFWDSSGNMSGDTVHTNSPTSSWWLFHWLAGMTGRTAKTTPPQANVQDTLQGIASLDTARRQAQVVLGGSAADTDVVINGVGRGTFGSKVEVTVQEDDWSGYEGASAPPRTISRTAYTPVHGSLTVPLTGLKAMSAYRITVTPDGGGTAAPADAPWSASYEAENSTVTSGTVTTEATGSTFSTAQLYSASGGKDVTGLTSSSSAVSFPVTVPTSGTYNLRIFYGNGTGTPAQQALRVDDANPRWVTYQDTLNPEFHSTATVPVALGAGSHILSLAKADSVLGTGNGSVTLDKIDLTAASGTPETTYEAAFADTVGGAHYDYSDIGETGTGAVVVTPGGTTTFDVYAPTDGYYTVRTDYSAARGQASLALNGTRVAALPSGSTTAADRLYLPEGINRIAISPDSGTMLTLRDLKVAGSGDTTGVTVYQAEDATPAGKAVVQSDAWASGGKDVGFIGDGGANTLTFGNVTVPSAGRYTIVVHYANNDRAGSGNYNTNTESRTAQLTVNGRVPTTLTYRNTYGWSDWWSLPATVTLNAGTNTLAFGNSSAYAPDIDRIDVAPVTG